MNFPNSRFYYSEPTEADTQEILDILEENHFDGDISLLYTRRPSPAKSFAIEGDDCIFAICRDSRENNAIAGFGICSVKKMFIAGKLQKVGYLEGLRVRNRYKKKFAIIPAGYDYIFQKGREKNIKYYYTTVLKENIAVQKLFEKKRECMPDYLFLDEYTVYIMKSKCRTAEDKQYVFRRAEAKDTEAIIDFINQQGKNGNFSLYMEDKFFTGIPGLSCNNFYLLYKNNEIVGCSAMFKQTAYKQYLVMGYSTTFTLLQKVSKLLNIVGLPHFPKPGEVVPLNMLAFFTIRDNNVEDGGYFLQNILNQAPPNELAAIGFASSNTLHNMFNKIKSIKYKSNVYLVDPCKGQAGVQDISRKAINICCSFL